MLRIGYPLATSKQKALFKAYVLVQMKKEVRYYIDLMNNKVEFDGDVEQKGFTYRANPNLFHLATAGLYINIYAKSCTK